MQTISSWLWAATSYLANTHVAKVCLANCLGSLNPYLEKRLEAEQLAFGKITTISFLVMKAEVRITPLHQILTALIYVILSQSLTKSSSKPRKQEINKHLSKLPFLVTSLSIRQASFALTSLEATLEDVVLVVKWNPDMCMPGTSSNFRSPNLNDAFPHFSPFSDSLLDSNLSLPIPRD